MARSDKTADRIFHLFEIAESGLRQQWEFINQRGSDFAHDNQLSAEETQALEDQGMPTFTINRIIPVVEMLNFYATANRPRWQAIGAEGSDIDTAAVFSDIADYIWYHSDGSSLLSNAVNDAVTKSLGFLMIGVDPNADRGMGEVVIEQPDPFDVFVDAKSRDILFKDASYIMVRKILPKGHLKQRFPDKARTIQKASARYGHETNYTTKTFDENTHDFTYKDLISGSGGGYIDGPSFSGPDAGGNTVTAGTNMRNSIKSNDEDEKLLEYFECYEKMKLPYMNVFYRVMPDEQVIQQLQQQVEVYVQELTAEMQVQFLEKQVEMQEAVENGDMLPERMEIEIQKEQKLMQQQIQSAQQERMSQLQAEASKVENKVVTEKEYKVLEKDETFQAMVIEAVKFYDNKIQQTIVIGDKTISQRFLPHNITEYPLVPIHYKWTGTPYPISAVSPLIGKQQEMNKAHQLMVHNASLGSSLRWMHEEGAIDTGYWEKYSSSPGALLPVRPGAAPPTPVMPAPIVSAFGQIVAEGKGDMEYLAGIYASMQGDTGAQHETYRGMLAMDEYGTRRIKYWLNNCIEPALRQTGKVIMQYSQAVYTGNKVFRIVQPNALQDPKEVEINVPMYNDMGKAIGKYMDYEAAQFDVRLIAGSTMPVNRWAYLEELKELMQLGVIDDIALLAETDIKNKQNIAQRKSQLAQMQGQVSAMEEQVKEKEGTIETLTRQLVQAGIKAKVLQGASEVDKKVHDTKARLEKSYLQTDSQQKILQAAEKAESEQLRKELREQVADLTGNKETS
jgi:hypothetical protein